MSSIIFQSAEREVAIAGPERYHFGALADGIFWGVLGDWDAGFGERASPLLQFCRDNSYIAMAPAPHFMQRIKSGWTHGREFKSPTRDGFFAIVLNTALAVGNDAIKLAARLHGQCEIYCYVEGPDRAWLASVIERAVKAGVYRLDASINGMYGGYDAVVALLRERADGPVVCSFSGSEGFPPHDARMGDGDDEDDEDEVSFEDGVAWLRVQNDKAQIRLDPSNWEDWRFGDGTDVFTLIKIMNKPRETPPEPSGNPLMDALVAAQRGGRS